MEVSYLVCNLGSVSVRLIYIAYISIISFIDLFENQNIILFDFNKFDFFWNII